MRTYEEGPRSASHGLCDSHDEDSVVEDSAQLRVCQRERPEAQVRGSVGHRPKHELDRVDHLVHHNLAEVEFTCSTPKGSISCTGVRYILLIAILYTLLNTLQNPVHLLHTGQHPDLGSMNTLVRTPYTFPLHWSVKCYTWPSIMCTSCLARLHPEQRKAF